ncbi:MAG: hypothetical protein WDA15_04590 [Trueperaceae bacterium]
MRAADILARLEELDLDPEHYVVHSTASLALRGVLAEAGDLDVVARGAAWEGALDLVRSGNATLDRGVTDQRVSLADDVEIYDGWLGESAASVIARAELVDGVPCAPISDVIAMKERLGRPKDQQHLELIRAYLAAQG